MRALNSTLILIFIAQSTLGNTESFGENIAEVTLPPTTVETNYSVNEQTLFMHFDEVNNPLAPKLNILELKEDFLVSPVEKYRADLTFNPDQLRINLSSEAYSNVNISTPEDLTGLCGSMSGHTADDTPVFNDIMDFSNDLYRYSTSCKEYLNEFDTSTIHNSKIFSGYRTKVNSDTYCDCVDELGTEHDFDALTNSEVVNGIKNNLYEKVIANRVYEFIIELKSNAIRYQDLENSSNEFGFEIGNYGCTENDIESMASELEQCFEGPAGDLIDTQNSFKDDRSLFTKFMSKKSENRLKMAFDQAAKVIAEGRSQESATQRVREQAAKFNDLFIFKYAKYHNELLPNLPRDYVRDVRGFLESNPVFAQDFHSYKLHYVDMYNVKLRTEARKEQRKESPKELTILNLSEESEDRMAEMFLSIVHEEITKGLMNGPEYREDPNYINNLMKGIASGDSEAIKKMGGASLNYLKSSYQENMQSCSAKVAELKKSCDPKNANDVMTNLSAQEIAEVNTNIDYEKSVTNSKLYCEMLDRDITSEDVANSSKAQRSGLTSEVFEETRSIRQKTFTDSPGTSNSSDDSVAGDIVVNNTERGDKVLSPGVQDRNTATTPTTIESTSDNYDFTGAADFLGDVNSKNNLPDSSVMNGAQMQAMIANPNTSVKEIESVKARAEEELQEIEDEISKNEGSVSAAQVDENNALKAQLDALKAQISELNSAIAKRDSNEESEPSTDEVSDEENIAQRSQQTPTSFSGFGSSSNIPRRENTFTPQQASRASTGTSAAAAMPTPTSGSTFSSAGQGLSAINKLGVTGGLGLSTSSGSSRSSSGTVSNSNIAQSDQRLVAEAISNGNTSVVLADGRVYYIGQDEEGNVILSETAEEVMAGVMGPEQEGPQLPKPKADDGPKREIASEPEATQKEESIYSKFLDAAEISE